MTALHGCHVPSTTLQSSVLQTNLETCFQSARWPPCCAAGPWQHRHLIRSSAERNNPVPCDVKGVGPGAAATALLSCAAGPGSSCARWGAQPEGASVCSVRCSCATTTPFRARRTCRRWQSGHRALMITWWGSRSYDGIVTMMPGLSNNAWQHAGATALLC